MREIINKALLGILVSFYLFPVAFTFLPTVNTKMMLAALGLLIFSFRVIRKNEGIKKSIISSGLLAILFSICCLFSAINFRTYDMAYAEYFVSFFVWIFGAYGVCHFLRREYGCVSLRVVVVYIAAVCVAQCALAQLIDRLPFIDSAVQLVFAQDYDFLHGINRMYGIGASLDNAGIRFSFSLLLISYFIGDNMENGIHRKELTMLSTAFILVTVFGNMISRTTTVGVLLGLGYIAIVSLKHSNLSIRKSAIYSWVIIAALVIGAVYLFSYLYKTDTAFHSNMRFAFEGFFNWVETGEFRTDSTDKLNHTMWVWPKDFQTWMIGTGKFENWAFGTDIGYCRFIMYCGLVGFSVFVIFFIHNTAAVAKYYRNFDVIAILLLVTALTVWLKVSTDIFQVYALLLSADGIIRESDLEEEEEEASA